MGKLNSFIHPDLINGNIFKSLIIFTLPLLISYVFQQLYNTADTVIIGNFLGESSLAAAGACIALFDLLIGFGVGFGNGLSIVAARAYGAGDKENLKKVTAASLVITIFITAFIFITTKLFLHKILELLGTPDEILDEAYSYISVITGFAGVMFAYNLFAGMLRAIGNSFFPLLFLIFSSVLNVLLDILFMTKFSLGITGAAFATVLAQAASGILSLVYIIKKADILVPSLKHFKFEKKIYRDLFGQGFSMALMSSLVMSGTVILQSAINGFGPVIIAGHICSRKIFGLTNIPIITLGIAFSTFTSQNLGAGKIERIKKGLKWGFLLCGLYSALMLAVIPLTIKHLAVFVSGSDNPELLNYTFKYLVFAVFFYFPLGGIFVARNSLQGLGEKLLPLVSSIIELIGKILFTALIIPHIGIWGVIMCEPLIWVVMFLNLFFILIKNPVFKEK